MATSSKPITELRKVTNVRDVLSRKKGVRASITHMLAGILERRLGTELLLELPQTIHEFGIESEEALRIIKRLADEGFPISYPKATPRLYDEPNIIRVQVGNGSGGAHLFDISSALWSALGEHLERTIWRESSEWYRDTMRIGSFKELEPLALDPRSIMGISEETRAKKNLPAVTLDSIFGWTPAISAISGEKRLLPLQLFTPCYREDMRLAARQEPFIRETITNGLGTGQSLEEAVYRGGLEVVERDAFMITYFNRLSPPRLDLEHATKNDERIASVVSQFKRYNLEAHALLLPTDLPIPVVAAVIIDRTGRGPAFTIGAKADFDLGSCVLGAMSEALSVRTWGKYMTPLPKGFRREKIARDERIIYWFDPSRLSDIEFMIKGPLVPREFVTSTASLHRTGEERKQFYERMLARLTEAFKTIGSDLFSVELTNHTVRKACDLRFAFALSPELQPLFLWERVPHLGGSRLSMVPQKLGYTPAAKLNDLPHPFP